MSAEPPPVGGNSGYNPDDWITPNEPVDQQYLEQNYLQFPNAQGTETLGDAIISGVLTAQDVATFSDLATFNNGIVIGTTAGIKFSDDSVQTVAFIEANYAQLNTDNTFLSPFINTFAGSVNLGSSATATTQTSGDSSTLVATTAFVQDAVQISGVQTTDTPLLWTGANTNQYNGGTLTSLPYSYPFGISTAWNITGGDGDGNIITNTGSQGAINNAFNIFCINGNQTGTQLQTTTPQLQLSNNGISMQVKDGVNIPLGKTYSINNVNILAPYSTTTQMNSAISSATSGLAPISQPALSGGTITPTPTLNVSNVNSIVNIAYVSGQLGNYATTTALNSAVAPLATTAYVNSVSPVYTASNIGKINTSPNSMFPTSQVTTTIQQGSFVQLTSTYFNVTLTSAYAGTLIIIGFSVLPWPSYPPNGGNNSYYISAINSTIGGAYQCTTSFASSSNTNTMAIYLPTGAPTTIGTVYSFNLATMGVINA